jgi:hypothetical protein
MGLAINSLAQLTAVKDIPDVKKAMGYQYAADKWTLSGLTPQDLDLVSPKRMECLVQMQCKFVAVHRIMRDLAHPLSDLGWAVEVKVLRLKGYENRIDTDRWRPMIMSLSELYGLEERKKAHSRLAEIDEERYRVLTGQGEEANGKVEGVESNEI